MTDTVAVPVAMLRRLEEQVVQRQWDAGANEVLLQGSAVDELIGLIPAPPKVGDKLTAEEVRQAPWGAILVDVDGDAWVRYGAESVYIAQRAEAEIHLPNPDYQPYTLVYLGG